VIQKMKKNITPIGKTNYIRNEMRKKRRHFYLRRGWNNGNTYSLKFSVAINIM